MVWIAVLAAWAVARLLQFLWNSNAETWTSWDGEHEIKVTLWQYVQWGQLKADLKAYIYFSWHFLCKVMKECTVKLSPMDNLFATLGPLFCSFLTWVPIDAAFK